MRKRKIAVFTASRTEYGILRPVIRQIEQDPRLDLQLIVAGTHFSKKFGETAKLIAGDGLKIAATVHFFKEKETVGKVGHEVGEAIVKMTNALIRLNPDLVLVNGDRSDALACAVAVVLLPKPLAHLHGGEITKGGTDEAARHAITKLAHIHFAATQRSRDRIIQMGENPKNVFWVGAPGLDDFVNAPILDKAALEKRLQIKIKGPLLVILQHPVTTSPATAAFEMKQTLEAVSGFDGTKVIIYPNGDPGSEAMIGEIEKYREKAGFYVFPSLERNYYINVLRQAAVIVGNSSGGIIETASIGLPAVNIGPRQFGRERNKNVIDVDYDVAAIKKATERILYDKKSRDSFKNLKNIYGDGKAAQRIVKILETIKLDQNLLQKHFYSKIQ